jgi:hypothetical protein
VRPYLGYGGIGQFSPEASSNYNGLQASWRQQVGSYLTLDAAYTYSRVLTDASSDTYSPQNSYDPQADYGPATFDKTHMLIVDYVWQLPTLAGRSAFLRAIGGGWQWSGLINSSSGEPLTASLGVYENSGVVDSTQRPNETGKAQDGNGRKDWLNNSAFSVPAQGTFGNSAVGAARLPHTTQFDSSVSKNFQIHERLQMQFRLEAINALNHTLFNGVDTYYYQGSPTFGQIVSANTPRTTQVGVHFTF